MDMARRDQEKRTVEVDRVNLIEALESNKKKHLADYSEAMAGYKSTLLAKIDKAFEDASARLIEKHRKTKERVLAMSDEDITKQRDCITLVDEVSVEMKVPRCYAKEYDAAIDMAKWDVRDTLELTHAEFTCFVRDQWDWTSGFEAVTRMYKSNF